MGICCQCRNQNISNGRESLKEPRYRFEQLHLKQLNLSSSIPEIVEILNFKEVDDYIILKFGVAIEVGSSQLATLAVTAVVCVWCVANSFLVYPSVVVSTW